MTWFRDLGVRVRLSAALAVMFALMLLVSVIGVRVLDRTEIWMNVLHRDTLTEVAAAMDLSREASELATSAPFLFALFTPFQLEQEVAGVMANLDRVRGSSANDPALELPLARLGLAIEDLARALLPQGAGGRSSAPSTGISCASTPAAGGWHGMRCCRCRPGRTGARSSS